MKVTLLRNWYNAKERQLELAGTEVDMPQELHDKYLKLEKEAGPEFIPYFAGTPETATWVKARAERAAKVKAENARRASVEVSRNTNAKK